MNIDKCIQIARDLRETNEIEDYGLDTLVVRICETYKKHMGGGKLNDIEKVIIGLRYSEFLADDNTEEELRQAEIKQRTMLDILEVNFNELVGLCEDVCNLK